MPPLTSLQAGAFDIRLLCLPKELQNLIRTDGHLDNHTKALLTKDVSLLRACIQTLADSNEDMFGVRALAERSLLWRLSALSPVRSLPTDVLKDIFVIVVKSDRLEQAFEKIRFNYAHASRARILSQVSHRWRDVAVSTSALWVKLSIDLRENIERRLKKCCDGIQIWLDCVGAQPLELRIGLGGFPDIEEGDHQRYEARRQAFYSSVIGPLLKAKTQRISLELKVSVCVQTSVELVGDALHSLGHLLTRLSVQDDDVEGDRDSLQSLDMAKKSCLALTELFLYADYAHLLPCIRAPNLKELHLIHTRLDAFAPAICSFLDDSPKLKVLKVNPSTVWGSSIWPINATPNKDGQSIGGVLRRLPKLKRMLIVGNLSDLVDFLVFVKNLNTGLSDGETILPRLEVLELQSYPGWARLPWIHNVAEVLWKAIRSLKDMSSPLKTVVLRRIIRTEDEEHEIERLRGRSATCDVEIRACFHFP
jgi:hypothetical protein